MADNYVFADLDSLIKVLRKLSDDHPDRVWVSGVTGKISAKAPTGKRKDAILSVDHVFDGTGLFVGNPTTALTSGGAMFLMHLPSDRINPTLLTDAKEASTHV